LPESSQKDLAGLSIGERDSKILALHESLFGSQLEGLVTCPSCGDLMEISLFTTDLLSSSKGGMIEPVTYCENRFEITFRLPTSSDLDAIAGSTDASIARQELFRRCILSSYHKKKAIPPEKIPPEVVESVIGLMEESDPLADIRISLQCVSCGNSWEDTFDICSFLWSEIHSWAIRTLRDVHILACAYGWQENDILAMNPLRRQIYLEMVGP
jgi:hypothetical protein